jgi:aminoglycoside/choline kinase family phosphotransferase
VPLPQHLDAITPDFLTESLRSSGHLDTDTSVVAVNAAPLADGVGFIGILARLQPTYAGPGSAAAPATMIAKIPTPNPDVRAMLKATRIFEREARFFAEVAPTSSLRVPTAYFVGFDVDADEFLLILEDLSEMPCGDQREGITVTQATAAVEAIAMLHAQHWNGAEWDWLPAVNAPINAIGEQIYYASLPGFLEVFGHLLTPEMTAIAHRFGPSVPHVLDQLAAMPATLVHFDYRSDNLFFGSDGQDPIAAIDFQTIARGGGVYDVAYLLSQNLSIEDRVANEDAILRTYHRALEANGVTGYSFEQIAHDYRIGTMYGWIIPVFAVGSLDVSSERAMQLWNNVVLRAQAAITHHRSDEFLLPA